jgi:hypothetical protein
MLKPAVYALAFSRFALRPAKAGTPTSRVSLAGDARWSSAFTRSQPPNRHHQFPEKSHLRLPKSDRLLGFGF